MDTRRRSLLKAVIWNLIGLISMVLVGYVATGSMALGGIIAIVNAVLGLACYLIYERVWNEIRWGRNV